MGRRMAGVRGLGLLAALLIGVDFLDEWSSGIPAVASPDIQSDFGISYGMAAGWVLTAFGLLAVVVEPPIFVLADRFPRRWFICGGLGVLGVICIGSGLAPSFAWLLVALLLFGPASGVGVGLSQATLMDAHPADREGMMVRWTLAGELGDLAAPGFLAVVVMLGGSWRSAFVIVGAVLIGYALVLWPRRYPVREADGDDDDAPFRSAIRDALANRRLLLWTAGALCCELMDEILVAFGALYLRDHLGADIDERAFVLSAGVAGGVVGLLVVGRLVDRFEPRRMLVAIAAASAVSYSLWMLASTVAASAAALFATGFLVAGHYPLAKAQAYRAFPGRSGTVNALLTLAGIAMLPVPVLLGFVADGLGLTAALALLLVQPLGLLTVALVSLRGERR